MLKIRVIPCLLLKERGLVKTVKFSAPTYVGDPINAVKIFNEKEVDELIFLDIMASKKGHGPNFELVADIATECFMPFCYGGGVRSVEDIRRLFYHGAEKVAINSHSIRDPLFIRETSALFGSQSIVVAIDVRKNFLGKYRVYDSGAGRMTDKDPFDYAREVAGLGAGEIFVNSVDRDGTMQGYDLELIRKMADAVSVPVIACGGAARTDDFGSAVKAGASAVAAGSMFVFHGKHRAVLITYPSAEELRQVFG